MRRKKFSFEANAKAKKEVLYNPTYKVCQKFQKEKKNQSLSLLLARCVTCVCLVIFPRRRGGKGGRGKGKIACLIARPRCSFYFFSLRRKFFFFFFFGLAFMIFIRCVSLNICPSHKKRKEK